MFAIFPTTPSPIMEAAFAHFCRKHYGYNQTEYPKKSDRVPNHEFGHESSRHGCYRCKTLANYLSLAMEDLPDQDSAKNPGKSVSVLFCLSEQYWVNIYIYIYKNYYNTTTRVWVCLCVIVCPSNICIVP